MQARLDWLGGLASYIRQVKPMDAKVDEAGRERHCVTSWRVPGEEIFLEWASWNAQFLLEARNVLHRCHGNDDTQNKPILAKKGRVTVPKQTPAPATESISARFRFSFRYRNFRVCHRTLDPSASQVPFVAGCSRRVCCLLDECRMIGQRLRLCLCLCWCT